VLALTLRSPSPTPPLSVAVQNGSYGAKVGVPLSVTAFRVTNSSKSAVTITQVRMAKSVPGLTVVGALGYTGCAACVTDSDVPPHVTPPTDVRAPLLFGVKDVALKPGVTVTLLLSVKLTRNGRVEVPPLRIDLAGSSPVHTIETAPGPDLCAGPHC
jgi:hypothetical protein